jgi:signal transduction histidine kinase
MALKLKTRLTLLISILVLVVWVLVLASTVVSLTRELVKETSNDGLVIANQIYGLVRLALATQPASPPPGEELQELTQYLQRALDQNAPLAYLFESSLFSPTIIFLAVTDSENRILAHSMSSEIGQKFPKEIQDFADLREADPITQLRIIYGKNKKFEVTKPMVTGKQKLIGTVHVVMDTSFIERRLSQFLQTNLFVGLVAVLLTVLLAAFFSHLLSTPLNFISAGVERMIRGEFSQPIRLDRRDEFGRVSSQLNEIGHRLEGNREEIDALRGNIGQIIKSLEEKLLLVSPRQEILLLSPSAAVLLNLEVEASLGKPLPSLLPTEHPLLELINTALGLRQDLTGVYLNLPGSNRTIRTRVMPLEEKGENRGVLVVFQDVETVARLEDHLAYARKLAALSRVTSGVAHEVKNPLNAIVIHLELLKSRLGPEAAGAEKSLQIITQEIKRLDRVVRSFLNFTKPMEIALADVSLRGLLLETIALLEAETSNAGIKLAIEIPASLPHLRIDRDLIKQCLLNIAQNGCQAMPEGGKLTISAAVQDSRAMIKIQDTGIGIPPENREKIFNLYYTTRENGSGIGLAMVFKIVQLHNGEITVESEVGHGSTFTMTFPVH